MNDANGASAENEHLMSAVVEHAKILAVQYAQQYVKENFVSYEQLEQVSTQLQAATLRAETSEAQCVSAQNKLAKALQDLQVSEELMDEQFCLRCSRRLEYLDRVGAEVDNESDLALDFDDYSDGPVVSKNAPET